MGQNRNNQRAPQRGGHDNRNHSGNTGRNQGTPLKEIHAPYNFVPLHKRIFTPDWGGLVSHDKPLRDGISGELALSIEAHTPILVGNEHTPASGGRPGSVHFHQSPDGRYMIPGSSLRGMLRNVLEIASFGRMRFVDDQRMGLRDLGGGLKDVYRNNLRPKDISAGWMRFINGKWEITPCEFVRVHHNQLKTFFDGNIELGGRQPSVRIRYAAWNKSLDVTFRTRSTKAGIKKAIDLGDGEYNGRIVFTGQPGGNKKHDFIFFNPREEGAFTLTPQAVRDFCQVHGDKDNKDNSWNYWCSKFYAGEAVPIFFVTYLGRHAVGLSSMFRLPYRHSIHDAIGHTSPEHVADKGDDLPALLFGYADDDKGERNLKGRVAFTPAFAMGKPQPVEQNPTILNGPKPSYYPNYIDQPEQPPGKLSGQSYSTFMDDHCEIRGFKRYPVRNQAQVQPLAPDQVRNTKVQVELNPLPRGTVFKATLKFHNLKPEELGAVVWGLRWGGDERLRHAIGMGKPFGFGQVSISLDEDESCIRCNDPSRNVPVIDACMELFSGMMNQWRPDWEQSPQMKQLRAMADPAQANGKKLAHMELKNFVESKKSKMVLAEYVAAGNSGQQKQSAETTPSVERRARPTPHTRNEKKPAEIAREKAKARENRPPEGHAVAGGSKVISNYSAPCMKAGDSPANSSRKA